MRKRLPIMLGALLACAGTALGQTSADSTVVIVMQSEGAAQTPAVYEGIWSPSGPRDSGMWGNADVLLWWVKSASLPTTLTTFVPGSPSALNGSGGALGQQGTIVLSPDHFNYDGSAGGRFGFGGWLDSEQSIGVEASGFFLGRQNVGFGLASTGTPALRVPFFNLPPGARFPLGESSFILSDPAFAVGGQTISQSLNFWGAEANALFRVANNDLSSMSLLLGFRYVDLRESLSITSNETLTGAFPAAATALDNFTTTNRFYGANLGVKAQTQFGAFDVAALMKLGLGDNHQTVNANGATVVTGAFPVTGTFPGGIFTQATNIGQRSRNEFCVLPDVQLQLGYSLSSSIRAFAGYNFMYMSDVVRPGDQVDRVLNFTTSPAISGVNPPLPMGAARPEPMFNGSGFWAQGINVGIEFKF